MQYVYGCKNKEHPRVEAVHRMMENPDIRCPDCGERMHRIPQAVRHYTNPTEVLYDYLDDKYANWRHNYKKKKRMVKN
jgi:DNA-directed RNA polymerase subunit RPC12/RpoP